MKIDKSVLFEISEIKSVSTNIVLTTGTDGIEVLLPEPNSVCLGTKNIVATIGQLVSIKAKSVDKENKIVDVLFIGKISEIKFQSPQSQKMSIKFSQYDKAIWDDYLKKIASNNSRVEKLFNSMREDE